MNKLSLVVLAGFTFLGLFGCADAPMPENIVRPRSFSSGNILNKDNVIMGRWEMVIVDNTWTGDFRWINYAWGEISGAGDMFSVGN